MAWAPSSAPFLRFSSRLSWLATSKKGARDHRNRSGTDFDPFKLFRLFPLSPSPSRLGRLPLSFLSTFVEHTKMKFQLALSTLLLGALSVQAVPHVEDKGLHARDGLSARGHAMFRYGKANGYTRRKTKTCTAHLSTNSGNANTAPASSSQSVAADGGANAPVITLPTSEPVPTSSEQPAPEPSPSSQEPQPVPSAEPAPSSGGNTASNNNPDIQAYLSQHNNERAAHGASALTWADDLAGVAQDWVNKCIWQHSGGKFGENLSVGTNMSPSGAVQLWLDERDEYNPASPQYSHWTQVVWKGSKEVGCAVASCPAANFFGAGASGTALFYACEYRPAGNVIGQFAQNVQK